MISARRDKHLDSTHVYIAFSEVNYFGAEGVRTVLVIYKVNVVISCAIRLLVF